MRVMLIRIMWCKEREENINKMLESLPKETEVIWDEKKDVIDTLCRALDTDEDVIIMEDDLELCDWFYEKAMAEIEKHPDCFIMFYSANTEEAMKFEDERYNAPRVWTQAYYIPWGRGITKTMIETIKNDDWYTPRGRYSNPMTFGLKKEKVKMHLVKPSLCQHLWFGWSLIPWHQHCNHKSLTYKKN